MTVILKETTMKMWNFRGHSVTALGLLATVFLFAPLGNATVLAPGQFTSSPVATTVAGTLDTTVTSPYSVGPDTGSITEWVVTDATTHDLDFIYQVDVTGGLTSQLSVNDYASLPNVDAYYQTTKLFGTLGAAGTAAPTQIANQAGGSIDFSFGGGISSGYSDLLVVETTATSYTAGEVFAEDGFNAPVPGLLGPTPEPSSVGLLLGGLFGLGLLVTRRFRAQQS
jgi:hypothetical protein